MSILRLRRALRRVVRHQPRRRLRGLARLAPLRQPPTLGPPDLGLTPAHGRVRTVAQPSGRWHALPQCALSPGATGRNTRKHLYLPRGRQNKMLDAGTLVILSSNRACQPPTGNLCSYIADHIASWRTLHLLFQPWFPHHPQPSWPTRLDHRRDFTVPILNTLPHRVRKPSRPRTSSHCPM
jgi:hypothetical protein